MKDKLQKRVFLCKICFDEKGQITVFLALLFLVLLGFSLVIIEGVESYSASYMAEDVIKNAGENIMANYSKELFKNYHIFFLDPREKEYILSDGKKYIDQGLSGSTFFNIHCNSLDIVEEKAVVDDDGLYFKHEIREWMKYREKVKAENGLKNIIKDINGNHAEREQYDKDIKAAETEEQEITNKTEKNETQKEEGNTQGGEVNTEEEQVSPETQKERMTWKEIKEVLHTLLKTGVLFYVSDNPEKLSNKSISLDNLPSRARGGLLSAGKDEIGSRLNALSFSNIKEIRNLFDSDISIDKNSMLLTRDNYIIPYNKSEETDFQKRIEDFIAWILTQIDYEDADAVQYMYRFYNKIRKLGFSKELLQRYVLSETAKENKDVERESYEEFFKESLEQEKAQRTQIEEGKEKEKAVEYYNHQNIPNSSKSRAADDKNKQRTIFICLISIFGILCIASGALEAFLIFSGMKRGFTENLFRYCIGGSLLILTFLFAIVWSVGRIRKITKVKKNQSLQKELHVDLHTGKEAVKRERDNIETRIETKVDWESEGEGTTILSGNHMSDGCLYPILREEETGIVYLIKESPFYIGSAGGNQLEIRDKTVSREHAVILEDIYVGGGEGYLIRDMNSTNGTWINDKKMRKGGQEKLKDGTIIRFAKKEYKFLLQNI